MSSRGSSFRRNWVSLGIVTWWLVMCAALMWREYLAEGRPSSALVGALASEVDERQDWVGIYSQGEKLGYANTKLHRQQEGWLLEEVALLRLSLLGIPREVRSSSSIITDPSFRLKAFRIILESGPTKYEAQGEVASTGLRVQLRSAGRARSLEVPIREIPYVPQCLRYMLLAQGFPEAGKRIRIPMLDPLTLTQQPMDISVEAEDQLNLGGRIFEAFRLHYAWAGMSSRAWISRDGEMLLEEGFGGLRMVKETQAQAMGEGWSLSRGVDLFRTMAVPAQPHLERPRELTYLRVRFSGAELSDFQVAGGRQRKTGKDVVEVFKEELEKAGSYELPHAPSSALAEALKSTMLIQSDDPAIREMAQRILAGERDAKRAVGLLLEWVHANVEKIPTISVPSAVEVLSTRQGDCNEHAVLFAALARAVGVPTKVCAGLLYQDGRFYYHAWNEVFLGSWFSLDPTLGQFPADAGHVKLVEGELEGQARLVPLMGKLKAQILDHR